MARVNFYETVTLPIGPGGSLIPVEGVATTIYTINPDGTEGSEGVAYAGRTGSTVAPSLETDATGTVSYWLDTGDYNIHFDDAQTPPRITSYIRGFSAADFDINDVIVSAQELLQFPGDLKYSIQATDHGLNSDGNYEWLLVTSAEDGGGRTVSSTTYDELWNALGNPSVDGEGNFRLPNISGTTLVATGTHGDDSSFPEGLTARTLLEQYGVEEYALAESEMPEHDHGGVTGTGSTGGAGPNPASDGRYYVTSAVGTSLADISAGSGGTPVIATNGPTGLVSISFPSLSVPALTINEDGSGDAHINTQPSTGMNLFVKT